MTWDELFECRPEDFTLRTMPARFAAIGDRHAGIDDSPCSLDALLELSARQEAEGLGDAPWPPHYAKQAGEPPRVQPSRRKDAAKPSGRRVSTKPLLEIARAAKKEDALARARTLEGASPRGGRATSSRPTCWWTRCAAALRPGPACASTSSTCRRTCDRRRKPLDPDYDPWAGFKPPPGRGRMRTPRGE